MAAIAVVQRMAPLSCTRSYVQVSKELGLGQTPSAFQIRFGGCKGVLSTCPSLDGKTIQIRKSMKKFESDHNKLDVITFSSPGRPITRSGVNYAFYIDSEFVPRLFAAVNINVECMTTH